MNWSAFHFFRQPGGISKNDQLEMLVCLDYERALESKKIAEFVGQLQNAERKELVAEADLFHSKFVRTEWDIQELIPAACVAASWFPKHWLEGSPVERRKIVKQLATVYAERTLPIWDFPFQDKEELELLLSLQRPHETLHVVAIDLTQAKSALKRKFERWIARGTTSREHVL